MSDHSEALRAITELGNEVADRSELVLDVNYDTYYLMDSSLTNAPQIIQSAAADEVLIFDEIAKPDTGKKGRNARLLLEGRIRDATDRLSTDVDRTSHYNPVYGSRLRSPLSRLRQKVSAFSAWSDNAKAPHDPAGQNRKRDLQQTSNIVAATDAFQRVALETSEYFLSNARTT